MEREAAQTEEECGTACGRKSIENVMKGKFEMREKTANRLMNKGFCFITALYTQSLFV